MDIRQHLKSKTQRWNLALAVAGIIELNFHLLRDNLGDSYGAAFILVSVVGAILRSVTTEAINAK